MDGFVVCPLVWHFVKVNGGMRTFARSVTTTCLGYPWMADFFKPDATCFVFDNSSASLRTLTWFYILVGTSCFADGVLKWSLIAQCVVWSSQT